MKRYLPLIIICCVFLLILIFLLAYMFPVYRSAGIIAGQKANLNIIARTESRLEIHIKPLLYAGEGAIVPFGTLVVVGPTSADLDMSDRSLIRFVPESRFELINEGKRRYSIKLIKGGFVFNRSKSGGLKSVRTALGDIEMKGTEGFISDTKVSITQGEVIIDEDNTVSANQTYTDTGKDDLSAEDMEKINTLLSSLAESDQKDTWQNFVTYLPLFRQDIVDNTTLLKEPPKEETPATAEEKTEEEISKEEADWYNFLLDLFKKKIDVYVDMYVLRLAITTDRYFNYDLSFPSSIESLNDEDASRRTHDPWGTRYLYTIGGDAGFNLKSAGPDTTMNTQDDIVLFTNESPGVFWRI